MTDTDQQPPFPRVRTGVAFVLAGLSLGASAYLRYQATRSTSSSLCLIDEYWDCAQVTRSSWGSLLGIPMSTWSLFGHLVWMGGLAVAWRQRSAPWLRLCRRVGALFAAVVLFMFVISHVELKQGCPFCTVIQLCTFSAALLLWLPRPSRSTTPGIPLRRLALPAGVLVLQCLVLAGAAEAYATTHSERGAVIATGDGVPTFDLSHTLRLGPESAEVQVVAFVDFACSRCRDCYATAKRIRKDFPDSVAIYFKHFPLDSTCNRHMTAVKHLGACDAALASQAARQLGRGEEAVDRLFGDRQMLYHRQKLLRMGRELGFERATWIQHLDSVRTRDEVQRDIALGDVIDIVGVPLVFVNGRQVDRAQLYRRVKELLR